MKDFRTEPHIVINDDRTITVPPELRKIAVQFDHNAETVTFDCPRYWDGIDMSEMSVYVNYMRPDRQGDRCPCKNVAVDEEDDNIMHFTWTLSRNATMFSGKLSFLVCITEGTDEDDIHWHSEVCGDLEISEGMECEALPVELLPDVVADMLLRMDQILIANTPILDVTLTTRGLAADAQATGNAIADLSEKHKSDVVDLASTIDAKVHECRSQVLVERKRIDNLISTSPGSLSGEAELQDIRVGGDGVVYANAGTAVREQISNVELRFADLNKDAEYIYNGYRDFTPGLVDGFVRYADGTISTDSFGGYYKCSAFIHIPASCYRIEHNFTFSGVAGYAFFDVNKNYISGGNTEKQIDVIPYNAYYIVISSYSFSTDHTGKKMTVYGGKPGVSLNNVVTNLSDIRLTTYGDSIIGRDVWQPYVVKRYGFTHTNLGIGSTTMAYKSDIESEYPCAVNSDRIQAIKNSMPDVIVIMAGTNDAHYRIAVGDESEFGKTLSEKDRTTFIGAYSYLVETLLRWKPDLRIIFMTPMHSIYEIENGYDYDIYAEAVRKVATYYAHPVADTNLKSGISKFDYTTYTDDGLHPNDNGGKIVANIVASELNNLFLV